MCGRSPCSGNHPGPFARGCEGVRPCEDKAHSRSSLVESRTLSVTRPSQLSLSFIFRLSLYFAPGGPFLRDDDRFRRASLTFIPRYHRLVARRGTSRSANHGRLCEQYPEPPYVIDMPGTLPGVVLSARHHDMTWPASSRVYYGSNLGSDRNTVSGSCVDVLCY